MNAKEIYQVKYGHKNFGFIRKFFIIQLIKMQLKLR